MYLSYNVVSLLEALHTLGSWGHMYSNISPPLPAFRQFLLDLAEFNFFPRPKTGLFISAGSHQLQDLQSVDIQCPVLNFDVTATPGTAIRDAHTSWSTRLSGILNGAPF